MMCRKKIKNRLFWQSVVLVAVIGCPLVGSDPYTYWIGTKGDWFDQNNWDAGVPDRWDWAEIDKIDDGEVGEAVISSGSAEACMVMMGRYAAGKVRQTGGSLTLYRNELPKGSSLEVGESPTAWTSSYLLSGGSISAEFEGISVAGTGVFEQTGGTNSVSDTLFVGYAPDIGHNGRYKLQAGSLSASLEVIGGYCGIGKFQQTGGTNSAGSIYVGWVPGAKGSYHLSETGQLQAATEIIGGYCEGYGGHGSFNQSGGTNIISGNLHLAKGLMSYGAYSLSGGTLQSSAIYIADGGTGIFCLSGGVLDTSFINVNAGGTVSILQDWSYDGALNINGGAVNLGSNYLILDSPGTGATVNMTNGTLSSNKQYVGKNGNAKFTQTGGINWVTDDMHLGYNSGASGTYNLNGTSELRVGGMVHISRTDGPGVGPPYPYGELLMNNGKVLGTTPDASITAHGSHANIIGQGTFDIKVTYESNPNYCGNQSVDVTLDRNHLLVGGTYSVDQITPVDFVGGTLTNVLESSVFNVSFDGIFSDHFEIAIPYNESEVTSLGFSESALLVFRETGPDTYEQLDIIEVDSARNRITARGKFFGKFAVATCMLETIDPYPDLIDDGEVIADPEQLGLNEARIASGLVADGVTPVLIRAHVPDDGTVEFSIEDENGSQSDIGYLNSPGGSEQVTTLTVDVDELADGRHMAFAVLTAPPAFFRGPGDESLEERPITIEATFTPSGGGDAVIDDRGIQLVRPPVIMVHGLWSDSTAFQNLNNVLDSSGFIFKKLADYDNKASFNHNKDVVQGYAKQLQLETRKAGYACSKVDIVAHSMGGLLSKLIPYDFAQESVRKIITVGTPYEGSPWADLLWQVRGSLLGNIIEQIICASLPVQPPAITGGAIEDLRRDPCNAALPVSTQVPGVDCKTVVVGEGLYAGLPAYYRYLLCLLTGQWTAETIHTAIFGPNVKSDWIVSEASQRGDAQDPYEISVLWHCTETSNADFINIVLNSLNQPAQISSMDFLMGSVTKTKEINYDSRPSQTMPSIFNLSGEGEPSGTVEIVEPNEGQTVIAGETVSISIEGMGDTNEATVFAFFGTESYANLVDLPWQDEVNVPTDSIGTKAMIIAVGLDPNRNLTAVDEVNLIMDTNVILEDIFFGFGETWYFDFKSDPGQSHKLQLYPIGLFSNGSEHPLSVLSDEKTYQSYNETVATVDPNGLLTVHSRGTAVVTVACSSKTASLIIEVDTYLGDINLNGKVDFPDFVVLADQWLQPPGYPPADIVPENGDNIVNINDLKALCDHWLEGTTP